MKPAANGPHAAIEPASEKSSPARLPACSRPKKSATMAVKSVDAAP